MCLLYCACQILFRCPTPAIVFETATKPSCFALFEQGAQSLAPAKRKMTSERPRVLRTLQFFALLPAKYGSLPQQRALLQHFTLQKCFERGVFDLERCFNRHSGLPRKTTSERPKDCSVPLQFLTLLTSKCASRHNGVCTFSTSQLPKVVRPWCAFVHFDLDMCFAPQRRATFHLSSGQMAPHPPL